MLAKENKKRLLALAITGTMVTGMLPVSAFAEDLPAEEPAQSTPAAVSQTESQTEGVQQPAPETPATEEPKAEEPKAETPATEEPKAEEPKAETPKAETPVTEEPKAEEPKAETPVTEEPKAEEPTAETPVTEETKVETPVTEDPATEEVIPEEKVPEAELPAQLLETPNLAQPMMLFAVPASDTETIPGDGGFLRASALFSFTRTGSSRIYYSYNGSVLKELTKDKLSVTHFNSDHGGNVIFCVAPGEGYAVTSLAATGDNRITVLNAIPLHLAGGVARNIVAQAEAFGCTAAFWYSRAAGQGGVDATAEITAQPYGVAVTQTASQTGKVAVGTEVTFTATPAPTQVNDVTYIYGDTATYTINDGNGKVLAKGAATKNADGTYSYTYTITDKDAGANLTASIEVPYTYSSRWGGGSFSAGAVTESTVMVQSAVEYRFEGNNWAPYPGEPKLPEDHKKWDEGKKFNIPQKAHSYNDVTTSGGVYHFEGWTVETVSGAQVPFDKDQKTFTMPAEAVVITGHWSFTAYNFTLYRKGYVSATLSGSPKDSYVFDSSKGPNGEDAIGNFPSNGTGITEADYTAVKTALENNDYAALAARFNNVSDYVPDSVAVDDTARTITVHYQRIQFYVRKETFAANGYASHYTATAFDMTGKLSDAMAAQLMQSGTPHDGNYVLDGERANANVGANTKFDVSEHLMAVPANNALTDALDKAKISYPADAFNGSGQPPIRWYLIPTTTNDGVHVDGVLTEGRVIYQWEGEAPQGVEPPVDNTWYSEGDLASVDTTKFDKITHENGTWEFNNDWTTDGAITINDGKFTMPDGSVILTGTWKFTPNTVGPVTESATYVVRYHNLTTNTDIETVADAKLTADVGTVITNDIVKTALGDTWQNAKLPAGYELVDVTYPTLAKGATNEVVVNYRQTTTNGGDNGGNNNNGGGNNGGNTNNGGDNNDDDDNTVNVTDPNVPLGGQPTDTGTSSGNVTEPTTEPTVTIEENEVPLTGAPEVTIEDGKTPLAATPDKADTNPNDVPRTGDTSPIAPLLALLGSALCGIVLLRKRDVQR